MRLFLILFLASPALADCPWLDGPKPALVRTEVYDANGRLIRVETTSRTTTPTAKITPTQTRPQAVKVEYGPAGNLRAKTLADGTRIEYGPLGREINRTKNAVVVPQANFPRTPATMPATIAPSVDSRNTSSRNLMQTARTPTYAPTVVFPGGINQGCSTSG